VGELTSTRLDITGLSKVKCASTVPTMAEMVTEDEAVPSAGGLFMVHLTSVSDVHESVAHSFFPPIEAEMVLSSLAKLSPRNVTEAPPLDGALSVAAILTIGASNVKYVEAVPVRVLTDTVV
jgi:hypothetical protein